MAGKRWPRIRKWLPRGGLGLIGYGISAGAFVCALLIQAWIALLVAGFSLPLCIWCAVGLRRDEAAEEIADQYVARGDSVRLLDMLSGQFESVRRMSNDIL